MAAVTEYLEHVAELLAEGCMRADEVEILRQPSSETRAQLLGRFEFAGGYVLDVVLAVEFILHPTTLSYSYQFRRPAGGLIFRYDRAAHHPWVSTFPHHKHLEDEQRVVPSAEPGPRHVQQEVREYLEHH